jgi:hypothetical protein
MDTMVDPAVEKMGPQGNIESTSFFVDASILYKVKYYINCHFAINILKINYERVILEYNYDLA